MHRGRYHHRSRPIRFTAYIDSPRTKPPLGFLRSSLRKPIAPYGVMFLVPVRCTQILEGFNKFRLEGINGALYDGTRIHRLVVGCEHATNAFHVRHRHGVRRTDETPAAPNPDEVSFQFGDIPHPSLRVRRWWATRGNRMTGLSLVRGTLKYI